MCLQYCTPNVTLQKMCVQSKREAAFQAIKLPLYYEKCVFKTTERLLLVYSATFVIRKKRRATFQFIQLLFYHEKSSRGCLLVYQGKLIKLLLHLGNMCVQIKLEAAFQFIQLHFVIQEHVCSNQAEGFFYNTKNICSKQAGCCFLVF